MEIVAPHNLNFWPLFSPFQCRKYRGLVCKWISYWNDLMYQSHVSNVGSTSFGTIQVIIPLKQSIFQSLVVSTYSIVIRFQCQYLEQKLIHLSISPPIDFDLISTDMESSGDLYVHARYIHDPISLPVLIFVHSCNYMHECFSTRYMHNTISRRFINLGNLT